VQQKWPLIDNLIGEQLDRVRYLKAKIPGRLQIDDELEFAGLKDRQISGLLAPKNPADVGAD
jgi:hypothetical protein